MRRLNRARVALAAALLSAALLSAADALARPGGGHTFGGGSSSSSSGHGSGSGGGGGSGGDGELVFFLIRLIFAYPKIGIPVVLVVIVLWMRAKKAAPQNWTSSHAQVTQPAAPASPAGLAALRTLDPDFSQVVLEDFAYRLYASAQRARSDRRELDALAPYLSAQVRSELEGAEPRATPVTNVVVGALRIDAVSARPAQGERPATSEITLVYEANLSFDAAKRSEYLRERWTLQRDASVHTKPPEETQRLGCPNCGAPFSASDGRRCSYCSEVVADGRFAWCVVSRSVLARESRPPALTSEVAEAGTDNPTVRDAGNDAAWRALVARDPAIDEASVLGRVRHVYDALNSAWSAAELEPMRALVSDGMFDYLRYWVEAYQRQGLRNTLTDMRIARVERVKVVSDRHFDAVTFRLWASGYDATVDAASGELRTGSTSKKRDYSEYWTLVRGAGARGKPRTDASCPSCAAPLQVTMAGTCKHCGSHLTRGEFDWVLSKIEQDDVYEG